MGRSYRFDCPECQYHAVVSGGEDRGVAFMTRTILCWDCRRLHDVVVCIRDPAEADSSPRAASLLEDIEIKLDLPAGSLGKRRPATVPTQSWKNHVLPDSPFTWMELETACPVNEHHLVNPWSHPGKCPQCENDMERSLFPYRFWD